MAIPAKELVKQLACPKLQLLKSGLPLALQDHDIETVDEGIVLINNIKGACTATDHLIRKRHAQPGCRHYSCSIKNFEERAEVFYKEIRKTGVSTGYHFRPLAPVLSH